MKELDIGDVATAFAAARTGQAFTLTVRSPVHEGHAITFRFKPASEPGRLGAAPMPQVALPSGIGLDWMTALQPDGGEPVPLPPPQLGRVQPIAPNLDDSKRAALAAALSVVSGTAINPALAGTDSITDAASAAAAVADTMDAQEQVEQQDHGPVYYLCVILRQGPLPPPPRQFPVSPFAMAAAAEEANNALGRLSNNCSDGGYPSTSSSRPLSPMPSCSSEQMAAELACSAPIWDSVNSQDLPLHKRLGRNSSLGAPLAVSFGTLQPDQSSGAWGLTDRPPASLGGLSLGALVGSGRGGRCYRGTWRAYPVAVKIVDLWEESVDGGASTSTGSTSSAPPSPAVADSIEPFGRALGGLPRHPNLVPVHASAIMTAPSGLPDRVHLQIWMIEQYCNRGGLGDAIDTGLLRVKGGNKGADALTVLLTARDIATGMHYLHLSGIVHGNLTGNNVLLTSDRTDTHRGWRAMVDGYALAASRANSAGANSDAGVASNASDSGSAIVSTSRDSSQHFERHGEGVGTNNGWYGAQPQHRIGHRKFKSLHRPSSPAHLPPEVLQGEAVCESTDLYSIGVLMWELWSGQRAWRTLGPLSVVQAVVVQGCQLPVPKDAPPALAELMQRCLSQDAEARPSFAEIVSNLTEQLINY